ncbi:MAG: hypothetical protein IJV86_04455, partial [Clostridia bacterium]|nr:hypothetical protein [Clostridia bacterium]
MKTETMLQPSSLCCAVSSLSRRIFMKHFVSCTPQACQAHKSMKHFAALAAKYEAPLVSGMKR